VYQIRVRVGFRVRVRGMVMPSLSLDRICKRRSDDDSRSSPVIARRLVSPLNTALSARIHQSREQMSFHIRCINQYLRVRIQCHGKEVTSWSQGLYPAAWHKTMHQTFKIRVGVRVRFRVRVRTEIWVKVTVRVSI